MLLEKMVEPAPHPCHTERQLVCKTPLSGIETARERTKCAIESTATLSLEANGEGRITTRRNLLQSSIPEVGDEGTAISLAGIRPAR